MINLNDLILCYKYTTSKLFYASFMMNVIDGFWASMISFDERMVNHSTVTYKNSKTVSVIIGVLFRNLIIYFNVM